MRRKKRPAAHASHDRWLVSYADFITLLFAFFVVLYAAAEINKKKASQVAVSIQTAFQEMGAFPGPSPPSLPAANLTTAPSPPPSPTPSPPAGEDFTALQHDLEQALAPEIARGEVAVQTESSGLVVSLREIGFFESGSAGIKARSQPALSRMAALLAQRKLSVRIEGHTDDKPIHTSQFTSNWELSTSRATEMVRMLITQYQVPPEQLSAAGYAEFHPVTSNATTEGRAKNRRVDVVILGRPNPKRQ